MFTKISNLCLALTLLGGCAYHEGQQQDINNPIVRKVGWFSYLDGNDIREACAAGGSERYRLVYNGQYEYQLRSYEIFVGHDGGGIMNVRAMNTTANLLDWTTNDLFSPWRWTERQVKLTPVDMEQFRRLLAESGYGRQPPQGLRLHSRDFYWVASGCDKDVFHFYAWNNRSQSMAPDGFAPIKFQDFLLKRDQTGISFRQPHVTSPAERNSSLHREGGGRNIDPTFTLTVKNDGLGGLLNAF